MSAVAQPVRPQGRKALYVNSSFTSHVVELSRAESRTLLDMLCRHIENPSFQMRHRWSPGTVAFWDNRSTQHVASGDYYPAHRLM